MARWEQDGKARVACARRRSAAADVHGEHRQDAVQGRLCGAVQRLRCHVTHPHTRLSSTGNTEKVSLASLQPVAAARAPSDSDVDDEYLENLPSDFEAGSAAGADSECEEGEVRPAKRSAEDNDAAQPKRARTDEHVAAVRG